MDNTNNNNKLDTSSASILAGVRKTVLITNMSLATAMEKSFMATYESDNGICIIAVRSNNTAVMAAMGTDETTIIKCDVVISNDSIAERKEIYQCGTSEDADNIWEILNDKMYDWSRCEINEVSLD